MVIAGASAIAAAPVAVIVLTFDHILLAAAADIVALIVVKVALSRSGRSLLLALPGPVVQLYAFVATNIKWLFAAGGAGLLLVWALDLGALVPLLAGGAAIAFVGGFFVFVWGGVVGLAVAVPALLIGMTYTRARRTMDDYRRYVGSEPKPEAEQARSFTGDADGWAARGPSAGGWGGSSAGSSSRPGDRAGWQPGGTHKPTTPPPPLRFAAEYQVLGLAGGASPDEIKRAWRAQVAALHPDLRSSDNQLAREAAQERLKYRTVDQAEGWPEA